MRRMTKILLLFTLGLLFMSGCGKNELPEDTAAVLSEDTVSENVVSENIVSENNAADSEVPENNISENEEPEETDTENSVQMIGYITSEEKTIVEDYILNDPENKERKYSLVRNGDTLFLVWERNLFYGIVLISPNGAVEFEGLGPSGVRSRYYAFLPEENMVMESFTMTNGVGGVQVYYSYDESGMHEKYQILDYPQKDEDGNDLCDEEGHVLTKPYLYQNSEERELRPEEYDTYIKFDWETSIVMWYMDYFKKDAFFDEIDSLQTIIIMAPPVYFVPWEEAGLEDHVMDWQDENLEAAMREITGIADGDIMLSDVWEITELDIRELDLYSIRIYSIDALGG